MKIALCTLGCKVNYYESKAISDALAARGYESHPFERGANVYIINTCAVTGEAERKAAQMVRRAVSFGAEKIIVTGCSAQLHPEKYERIDGVLAVIGNREKLLSALAVYDTENALSRSCFSLEGAPYEEMTISGSERTRAYVKVEDGCDSRCTYCIIRKARGGIRSRSIENSLAEVRALAAKGYREIVFCGIEISGFGKDTGESLADLIRGASLIDGIERIRLSSVDPAFLKPSFIDEVSEIKQFTPYFHLSIQSGSSSTLARMKRRYTSDMLREYTEYIRRKMPLAEFAADIIVGFPGETEEEFEETCSLVKDISLQHFHIFTYSKRPGTEAAEMEGQIDTGVKRSREKRLSQIRTETGRAARGKYIGMTLPVLFETFEKGVSRGHTENFIEVSVKTEHALHGVIKDVLIESVTDDGCIGTLI